jgi:hypothetical protein
VKKAKLLSEKEWRSLTKELEGTPAKIRIVQLYNLLDKASDKIRQEVIDFIRVTEEEIANEEVGDNPLPALRPRETDLIYIAASDNEVSETGESKLEQMVAGVSVKHDAEDEMRALYQPKGSGEETYSSRYETSAARDDVISKAAGSYTGPKTHGATRPTVKIGFGSDVVKRRKRR